MKVTKIQQPRETVCEKRIQTYRRRNNKSDENGEFFTKFWDLWFLHEFLAEIFYSEKNEWLKCDFKAKTLKARACSLGLPVCYGKIPIGKMTNDVKKLVFTVSWFHSMSKLTKKFTEKGKFYS